MLLVFGDAHINRPNRSDDICKAFVSMVDHALEMEGLTHVIFTGDMYMTPSAATKYKELVAVQLKRIASKGIQVIIIPGNHDYSAMAGKGVFHNYQNLPYKNITVLEGVHEFETDDFLIHTVSWLRSGDRDNFDSYVARKHETKTTLLFAHATIDSDKLPFELEKDETVEVKEFIIKPSQIELVDLAVFGHIHSHIVCDNMMYIGSVGIQTWGEKSPHYYITIDESGTPTYYEYEFPDCHKHTLNVKKSETDGDDITEQSILEKKLAKLTKGKDYTGAYVRLKVISEKTLYYDQLYTKYFNGAKRFSVVPVVDRKRSMRFDDISDVLDDELTPTEMIQKFLEATQKETDWAKVIKDVYG